MATSNTDPGLVPEERSGERTLTRYDLLLLVIPATFLLAIVGAQVSSLSSSTLLGAASVVAALAVVDGLFVNPPQGPEEF